MDRMPQRGMLYITIHAQITNKKRDAATTSRFFIQQKW
jgi:hypothetical protein